MSFPAARVADLHICPMVTGVVPHVGGPILPPGVPTVLVAGMPAATVGSMCVCVGPPDVITKGSSACLIAGRPAARMTDQCAHGGMITIGCPTVLIGESGSGSGGPGRAGQVATMMAAQTAGMPFVKRSCDQSGTFARGTASESEAGSEAELTFVGIELVDADQLPVPGVRYRLEAPGGVIREGVLDANGRAREVGLKPGTCQVTFPELDKEAWSLTSGSRGSPGA